jgi:hypothetical protein
MPAIVAITAQSDHAILQFLLDMVGITNAWLIAH